MLHAIKVARLYCVQLPKWSSVWCLRSSVGNTIQYTPSRQLAAMQRNNKPRTPATSLAAAFDSALFRAARSPSATCSLLAHTVRIEGAVMNGSHGGCLTISHICIYIRDPHSLLSGGGGGGGFDRPAVRLSQGRRSATTFGKCASGAEHRVHFPS